MKKESLYEKVLYIILFLLWIIPSAFYNPDYKSVLCCSIFVLSVLMLYMIKNKAIAVSVSVLLCAVTAVFQPLYPFSVAAALFLIIAHSFAVENTEQKKVKKNSAENAGLFVTGAVISIFVQLILCFVKTDLIPKFSFTSSVKSVLCLTVIPVALLIYSFKSRNKESEKINIATKSILKRIYIVGIMALVVSIFEFVSYYGFYDFQQIRISFCCWFVFILVLFYNRDPHAEAIFNSIKKKIDTKVQDKKSNSQN